jgi:type I restriction enzyme S subunit
LVAEQEKLIELLKEKRQAVISHAVTKGLEPNVPMKDSGVEWLGEVPEHWEVQHLKRTLRSCDYGISDSLLVEGKIAVLRMGNIQDGKITKDDIKYTDSVPDYLLLESGDLLFNRTNSLDLIGKVGMFQGNENYPTSFASYLVRLRVQKNFDPLYFSYLLNTSGILGEARSLAFVAIGQCNLNPTRYGLLRVAIPPCDDQKCIASFLSLATGKLDELTKEAQHTIDLLKERRAALISAAVTGKIDVRGLAEATQ